MATKNADVPAFPCVFEQTDMVRPGMTKREYFAGLAMQGLIARGAGGPTDVARDAVMAADALLKVLGGSQ